MGMLCLTTCHSTRVSLRQVQSIITCEERGWRGQGGCREGSLACSAKSCQNAGAEGPRERKEKNGKEEKAQKGHQGALNFCALPALRATTVRGATHVRANPSLRAVVSKANLNRVS